MRRLMLFVLIVSVLFVVGVSVLFLVTRPKYESSEKTASPGVEKVTLGTDAPPMMGLNLTAYTRDGYGKPEVQADIDRIASLGANSITLTPTWYMDTGSSNEIRPDKEKTPSMQSLRLALGWIEDAGLKVVLKPHVDVLDGTFRGDIQPADRQSWFRSYQRFIELYAAVAAERDAELFVVGTELKSLSGDLEPWRSVIKRVKTVFPGRLTYAANWDEFEQVRFWDDLDLIGVDAYFPLAEGNPDPDHSALTTAWEPIVESLRAASEQWGIPVLITEVGYPSQAGATAHPWEVREGDPADPELQARAYQAVFDVFRGQSWLVGINWWSWRADPGADERPRFDYTPEGKAAEDTLRWQWSSPTPD